MFDLLSNGEEFRSAIELLNQEQFETVVQLLRPAITQSADNLDESLLLLSAYLGLMRYEPAEKLSLRMMATYPDDLRALYGRSLYLYHTKMFTLGLHYIGKALKRNSNNADILALAGALAFETHALSEASNYIKRALELNPTHPLATNVYGVMLHVESENASTEKIVEGLSDESTSMPLNSYRNEMPPPQPAIRASRPKLTLSQLNARLTELTTRLSKYSLGFVLAVIVIGLVFLSIYRLNILGSILVILVWFPLWRWSSNVYRLIFQTSWYKLRSNDNKLTLILFAVLILTFAGTAFALYGVVKPIFLISALNCWACIYVLSYYHAYGHARALIALVFCMIGLIATLLATWLLNKSLFYVAAFVVTISMFLSHSENKT